MVEKIIRLEKGDTLFLLGDYIDRGQSSREVIDYILQLKNESYTVKPVMGNHEFMLLRSLEDPEFFRLWIVNGCAATLLSFGADPEKVHDRQSVFIIPDLYIRFFSKLPLYEETEDFLIVHAGVPPGISDIKDHPETVLWTRDETINEKILGNRRLVHGHTPVPKEMIRERIGDPKAKTFNLDAGCVYNRFPSLGNLAALNMDSLQLFHLENIDQY
jgi:serine/threonine protein phosphatase 1